MDSFFSTNRRLQETSIEDLPDDMSQVDVVRFWRVRKYWRRYLSVGLEQISINMCPEFNGAFIKWVTQYMHSYDGSLKSFQIRLCFTRQHSMDIDSWISIAIRKGVETLCIRPVCALHFKKLTRDDQKYFFPWSKLQNLSIAVQYLHLSACIFQCFPTSKWVSLLFLHLFDTIILAEDMETIWLCFPNLQTLGLYHSEVPAKITVTCGSLRSLIVWYCPDMKEIDLLGAKGLMEFDYRGKHIDLDHLNSSPELITLMLGFEDVKGEDYIFQNLRGDTIRYLSIFKENEYLPQTLSHGQMTCFPQLTELKLYNHPTRGMSIQTLTKVLSACPVLRSLAMVPPCTMDAENLNKPSIRYRHKCLRFIQISGFCGSKSNVAIARFLIQVPEELDHVVVESKIEEDLGYNYLKHSKDWHGEKKPEAIKRMLLKLIDGDRLTFSCTQTIVQTNRMMRLVMNLHHKCKQVSRIVKDLRCV